MNSLVAVQCLCANIFPMLKFIHVITLLVHLQMLVYEFMPNGSLQDWLSGNEVFHNYKL